MRKIYVTTNQTKRIASSLVVLPRPLPEIITVRKESRSAVSGKYFTISWTILGRKSVGKKVPESIIIGRVMIVAKPSAALVFYDKVEIMKPILMKISVPKSDKRKNSGMLP